MLSVQSGTFHNGSDFFGGFEVDDGTKLITFGLRNNSTPYMQIISWDTYISYNSVLYQENPTYATQQLWQRVSNNGTTLDFQYSYDGIAWYDAYSQLIGAFLSGITNCGIVTESNSGVGSPSSIDVLSLSSSMVAR
jgi:hypothetical protein